MNTEAMKWVKRESRCGDGWVAWDCTEGGRLLIRIARNLNPSQRCAGADWDYMYIKNGNYIWNQDTGDVWWPLPEELDTLEKRKEFALVMWRMA